MTGRASWNVDDFGPEVVKDQRVDNTVEEFDAWLAEADRPPSFGRNTLGALVSDLGLTVAERGDDDAPGDRRAPGRARRASASPSSPGA